MILDPYIHQYMVEIHTLCPVKDGLFDGIDRLPWRGIWIGAAQEFQYGVLSHVCGILAHDVWGATILKQTWKWSALAMNDWTIFFYALVILYMYIFLYIYIASVYIYTFTLPSMLIRPAKVFRVGWWMGHYASQTPKRHFAYSNSPWVKKLDRGVLQWKNRLHKGQKKVQTAVAYKSKTGKKCYHGTAALKGTENLGLNGLTTVFRSIYSLFAIPL